MFTLNTLLISTLAMMRLVAGSATPIVAQYWPAYNSATQSPAQITSWNATDIMFYFVTVTTATGMEVPSDQSTADIESFVSLAKANNVIPVFTIGGWTGSRYFAKLAASAELRTSLANDLKAFADQYGFQGVDVDWEYPGSPGIGCNDPTANDAPNFILLLKELRSVFGKDAKLMASVAMDGIQNWDGKAMDDVSDFAEYLDHLQIMAYDVSGAWSETTGPSAPLRSCSSGYGVDTAVEKWLSTGFPAEKILLGVPGYGISFTTESSQLTNTTTTVGSYSSQLYNPKTSTTPKGDSADVGGEGTDVCTGEKREIGHNGQWQMKNLIAEGLLSADEQSGLGGFQRHWDECTATPFLFNPDKKVLISYDDSQSVKQKAEYAMEKGLGGIMVFDTQGFTTGVYDAMREGLGVASSPSAPSASASSSSAPASSAPSSSAAPIKIKTTPTSTQAATTTTAAASATKSAAPSSSSSPPDEEDAACSSTVTGVVKLEPSVSSPAAASTAIAIATCSEGSCSSPPASSSSSSSPSILCTSSNTWSLCSSPAECTPMGVVAEGTQCVGGEIVWSRMMRKVKRGHEGAEGAWDDVRWRRRGKGV